MSQNMQAVRRALRPTKKKVIVLAAVAVVAVGGTLAWRHFAGQKNSALPALRASARWCWAAAR